MPGDIISPTIYGIENEYSVLLSYPGKVVHEIVGQCHSVDEKLGLYVQPEQAGGKMLKDEDISDAVKSLRLVRTKKHKMLSNGGRLYLDPSGPEYAGPETSTAEEAVHRTFEGDFILNGVLEYLRKTGTIEGYQLNRRIVDHNRSSRGVHLNTTTLLTNDQAEASVPYLAAINAVKGAMFGSGGLLVQEDGSTKYHHSPRLSLTSSIINYYDGSVGQYRKRPLVRLPFEDDGTHLWRVETVTSDALNFGWPLRASLVVTNALIKMLELRRTGSLYTLLDPVSTARLVGENGNDCKFIAINKSEQQRHFYPVDFLSATCEYILDTDNKEDFLDAESRQVLPEIIETADMIKMDDPAVATRVESIARKIAIEKKMQKSKIGIDSEKICAFDYYWDWLGGGLAQKLREKNLVGWHGFDSTKSASSTVKSVSTPPDDTRAKIRGEQILVNGSDNDSSWSNIHFGDHAFYVAPDRYEIECIPEDEYPLNQK